MSVELLIEAWDLIKGYIPKKERVETAESILNLFEAHTDMSHIDEYLNELDGAFKTVLIERGGLSEADDEDDAGFDSRRF